VVRLLLIIGLWVSWLVATAHGADVVYFKQFNSDFLHIKGKIDVGDDAKFKNIILSLYKRGIEISGVGVYSPGGAVFPSRKIGRYIRTMYLGTWAPVEFVPQPFNMNVDYWTQVYQTRYCIFDEKTGMDPSRGMNFNRVTRRGDPNCVCASACFLIWAAGAGTRQVSRDEVPGAMKQRLAIDIHRPYFDPKEYALWQHENARERYEALQTAVETYLREMEVPGSIIRRMFSISSNETSRLTHEEALLMNDRSLVPPYLDELYRARCGKDYEVCGKKFWSEVYSARIKELEKMD
jgi:hypothetical protein